MSTTELIFELPGDELLVQEVEGAASGPQPMDDVHIDELLHIVVEKNASDLHICYDAEPIIRTDGHLVRLNYEKLAPTDTARLMYEIITDEQIQKFESTMELDFSYSLPKKARFRVNIYRDRGAIAGAFRLIPNRIPTVRELNLPPVLEDLTSKPRGLILVTGPTGSGKSTSLAAMINQINRNRATHIITIEDPIEYLHQHNQSIINQRELGQDTKSFSNALRACLREDPDVILVGEMRDQETIALAITAAETGHLVFATLHTNNAAESIDRVIDVFPARTAGPDSNPARQQLAGRCRSAAPAARRRTGSNPRHRGHGSNTRYSKPHPREQNPPDSFDDPNERRPRHAVYGPKPSRPLHEGLRYLRRGHDSSH